MKTYIAKCDCTFGGQFFAAGEVIVDVPEEKLEGNRFVDDGEVDVSDVPEELEGVPGAVALADAVITTLDQLRELTAVEKWFEPIPGVGPQTATAIEEFLTA